MLDGLLNVQVQAIGDRLALEENLQRRARIAFAFANSARDPDVGQELHVQAQRPVPLAQRAAPECGVEAKGAWNKTASFALGQLGEQIPYLIEELGVGRRVAPGRSTDRRLVDFDELVQMLDA